MFRPCIDLHDGKVKQIVGGTLESGSENLKTNFESDHPAAWYAEMYKRDGLKGGHVVMLGPGNEDQAREALGAYPGGLQVGGGINIQNATSWLEAGASHVLVTSWLFEGRDLAAERLQSLSRRVGKSRLVVDLSCRKRDGIYWVVKDRFQTFTTTRITQQTLHNLAEWCAEFLLHAVDVEGLCRGIDRELVAQLGQWVTIPTTYAGGAKSLEDLDEVTKLGARKIDLTIGSALDIFGGHGVRYRDAVAYNQKLAAP